jgi:hypothetical protein
MTKFIGIITDDFKLFPQAVKMLKALYPNYTVIENAPVSLESEADTINLQEGMVIRILPDYVMPEYEHVDANITAENAEHLYHQLEKLSMQTI